MHFHSHAFRITSITYVRNYSAISTSFKKYYLEVWWLGNNCDRSKQYKSDARMLLILLVCAAWSHLHWMKAMNRITKREGRKRLSSNSWSCQPFSKNYSHALRSCASSNFSRRCKKGLLRSFGCQRLVFSTGTGFSWCMIVGECKIVIILGSLEAWSGNGQLIQHYFLVEGSVIKSSTGVSTYLS